MTRRRRPLLPEEWAARQRRQMSTGRGQANARPVKVSASRVRTQRAATASPTSGLILSGTSSWSVVDSWGSVAGWDTSSFPGVGLTAGSYIAGLTVTVNPASGKYVRAGLAYQFSGAFAHTPPENVVQGPTGSVQVSCFGAFHLAADDSYAIDFFANRYTSATGIFDAALTPGAYLSIVRISD